MQAYPFVIIGGGPAGLSAAYDLGKRGESSLVLEKDDVLGGLSRTVEYKGFRCDIGGHRFFTKMGEVDALWREVLTQGFLRRPRLSRIYYNGKFYNYPLKIGNAFKNLGFFRSARIMLSLFRSRLFPRRPEKSFTDWVSNRFGHALFETFFRAYTEKVWGISCDELSADWAAQRIRNLSLGKAIWHALGFGGKKAVASLIDEFDYPEHGPGQMYEEMGKKAVALGGKIQHQAKVVAIEHKDGKAVALRYQTDRGIERVAVDRAVINSMPLDELVKAILPPPPPQVLEAAAGLRYRSLITVNLLLNQPSPVPDTWLYIHDPQVAAGRIQFYGNWSPKMVPSPDKCVIGLEYFATVGDKLWELSEEAARQLAFEDLGKLGLVDPKSVFDAFRVRYANAYPVYDEGYQQRVATIRQYLSTITNLHPVGRYGQFRYNNMDHSILTALYAVRRAEGENIDPWSVNEEAEYHEESKAKA